MNKTELERGSTLTPRYDENGLIPCVVTSAHTRAVLMVAYMNAQALSLSLQSGEAHYWSRSRQEIWHKGATSGQVQTITSMRIDCDQDCLWIEVEMPLNADGHEVSCHTGAESCFYRHVALDEGGTPYLKR